MTTRSSMSVKAFLVRMAIPLPTDYYRRRICRIFVHHNTQLNSSISSIIYYQKSAGCSRLRSCFLAILTENPQLHAGDCPLRIASHLESRAVCRYAKIQRREITNRKLGDLAALFKPKLLLHLLQTIVSLVLFPGHSPVKQLGAGACEIEIVSESKFKLFQR